MKKIFFFLAIAFLIHPLVSKAQSTDSAVKSAVTDTLPYQKYPTLPAFKIVKLDSATVFNTYNIPEGRTTVLLLFSADCEHCQRQITRLLNGIDSLKNIDFYLASPSHIFELKKFYEKNHLGDYKNIKIVGRDYEFFFFSFYGVKFVPYVVVYDKHKKLVKAFTDGVKVKELYELTHKQ